MSDFKQPSVTLLARLGSIAVHVEEAISPGGHSFDVEALRGLLACADVQEWLGQMRAACLLPRKRTEDNQLKPDTWKPHKAKGRHP